MEPTNPDTKGELFGDRPTIRVQIGARIREALRARFGDEEALAACERLGISVEMMLDYEAGAMMPPETLLQFLVLMGINPAWLLKGRGPWFVRSRLRLNGPVHAGRDTKEEGPADPEEPDG